MKCLCGARGSMSRFVKLQRPPPEMRIFSAIFSLWSTSSTRSPRWPATPAQKSPAAPAPTMTASNLSCMWGGAGAFSLSDAGGSCCAQARRVERSRLDAAHDVTDHDDARAREAFARDGFGKTAERRDRVLLARQAR